MGVILFFPTHFLGFSPQRALRTLLPALSIPAAPDQMIRSFRDPVGRAPAAAGIRCHSREHPSLEFPSWLADLPAPRSRSPGQISLSPSLQGRHIPQKSFEGSALQVSSPSEGQVALRMVPSTS